MDMDVRDLFSEYFLNFCKERKIFFKKYWVSTFFGRIINRDSTVQQLLNVEIYFETEAYSGFSLLVQDRVISRENVVDYSSSLKVFKDEITNRNTFIIINVAILTILVKLIDTHVLDGQVEIFVNAFYFIISIFVIGLLLERDGLSKRGAAATQLITIIDKWLTKNPEVSKDENPDLLEVGNVATEMRVSVIRRWLRW